MILKHASFQNTLSTPITRKEKQMPVRLCHAVLNGPVRLGKGCGLDPQFGGVATSTLTLNSLYKIKLLTLLTQVSQQASPESHLRLYIYMLLCTLKKEFYCAFHISKFSYHFIFRFLGKGRGRLRKEVHQESQTVK